MTLRYLLAWIPMVVIAVVNGILREATYGGLVSELTAHQISTVILLVLFALYIWWISKVWEFPSGQQALAVGLLWLFMTVAFEVSFGHWVAGHPWQHLIHDYNLAAGRLWALVLLWVGIVPWIFHRLVR